MRRLHLVPLFIAVWLAVAVQDFMLEVQVDGAPAAFSYLLGAAIVPAVFATVGAKLHGLSKRPARAREMYVPGIWAGAVYGIATFGGGVSGAASCRAALLTAIVASLAALAAWRYSPPAEALPG